MACRVVAIATVLIYVTLTMALPRIALAGGVTTDVPGEATGNIRDVNTVHQFIVLDDGAQLWAITPDQMEGLREGARVRVNFEQRAGRKMINRIEAIGR